MLLTSDDKVSLRMIINLPSVDFVKRYGSLWSVFLIFFVYLSYFTTYGRYFPLVFIIWCFFRTCVFCYFVNFSELFHHLNLFFYHVS